MIPTPPVLFMTAEGEVLGEASNFASPDVFLATMLKVLKEHPEYNQASEAEKNARSAVERAENKISLQDYDGARAILEKEDSAMAHYLLGRLARFRQDWEQMEMHFKKVNDAALTDDLRMERAYRFWFTKQYAKLIEQLKDYPNAHKRYAESRYYQGLALYHLGEKEKALSVWKETIQVCSQNPWIYRADWAYTNVTDPPRTTFSTADKSTSVLNRVGYLGAPNPDLKGPSTK